MQDPALPGMMRFALYAGLTDVQSSFRRTILGPLWSTIGLATLTASLGLFFGTVLKQQLPEYEAYIPFLATGLIAWTFLANCIHQSCSLIWQFLNTLRHNRMPLLVPVLRVMVRNIISLGVNVAVTIIAIRLFLEAAPPALGPLLGGLVLFVINVLWMSYLAALLCARFRDLPQLIAWGIHLAFFLSPILWLEYNLGRFAYLVQFNPFSWLIALIRQPLLGLPTSPETWMLTTVLAGLGILLCVALGRYAANRLAYWL
ncbi:hypothetical protein [Ferrovibrio terrae]|uniref:ABC transporter permease n=1 Tax=Ferrovibrio terrae TaxID=2594003 RepID=UPI003137E8BD